MSCTPQSHRLGLTITLFIGLFLFVSHLGFSQATYTSNGTGNWETPATWTGGAGDSDGVGTPDADDIVEIRPNHQVTVNAVDAAASSISFLATATATGTITVNFNRTLTVTNNI